MKLKLRPSTCPRGAADSDRYGGFLTGDRKGFRHVSLCGQAIRLLENGMKGIHHAPRRGAVEDVGCYRARSCSGY